MRRRLLAWLDALATLTFLVAVSWLIEAVLRYLERQAFREGVARVGCAERYRIDARRRLS